MAGRNGVGTANATISERLIGRCKNVRFISIVLRTQRADIEPQSLELGAGGGLVGLGVAMGCKVDWPIYITDQENMVDLMRKNIRLNSLESRVKELVLNWYVTGRDLSGFL
jgi:methylase of polypeptide subunit release factors